MVDMVMDERSYPTALAAGPGAGDTGVRTGIAWVLDILKRQGGQVLVYAPGKQNIERHTLLSAFSQQRGVAVGTWRRSDFGWSGGPVLAAWPDRAKLGEIADDSRTTALCVVPWSPGEVDGWVEAHHPELLPGAEVSEAEGDTLHPVVAEGLKTLTASVNHGNHLTGALDRRDAVAVLRALREAGYRWSPDRMYSWALMHEWPAPGAERLRALAKDFEDGKRPQLKGGNPLRPDIVDMWRVEAGEQ